MTPMRKLAVYAFAVLCVGVLGSLILVGTVYASSGVVSVRVADRESGVDFYLPIPATVLEGMVATGDHLVGAHGPSVRVDVPELEHWMPKVDELLAVFDDIPDVVLVEVEDGRDRVRVAKRGGSLEVRVHSPGTRIEVSVPVRTARRIVSRLAA